jgi:fatty acid desaturase
MQHHQYAGTDRDPDIDLVEGFPVSAKSLRRKFVRDLVGITGVKRVYGSFLIDLGLIQYTVSSRVIPSKPESLKFRTLVTKVLMQVMGFGISLWLGHPELYLIWLIAYLTTFSLFIRIRSIAEHACTGQDIDPMKNTRTTYASILDRLTVAPHRVNYHLEHHLLMSVPYFNLPKLHELLKQRGALEKAHIAKGYLDVLSEVTKTMNPVS